MSEHQREGREAEELGESPSPAMRSAGRSGALNTGRRAFGGPGDWRWGERETNAEFESASEERKEVGGSNAGRTECFFFSFFFFVFISLADWGEED